MRQSMYLYRLLVDLDSRSNQWVQVVVPATFNTASCSHPHILKKPWQLRDSFAQMCMFSALCRLWSKVSVILPPSLCFRSFRGGRCSWNSYLWYILMVLLWVLAFFSIWLAVVYGKLLWSVYWTLTDVSCSGWWNSDGERPNKLQVRVKILARGLWNIFMYLRLYLESPSRSSMRMWG